MVLATVTAAFARVLLIVFMSRTNRVGLIQLPKGFLVGKRKLF